MNIQRERHAARVELVRELTTNQFSVKQITAETGLSGRHVTRLRKEAGVSTQPSISFYGYATSKPDSNPVDVALATRLIRRLTADPEIILKALGI